MWKSTYGVCGKRPDKQIFKNAVTTHKTATEHFHMYMWKSTHSVCGTRPDKEADGKVQVDGDCTKFTHPSYYDHVVDGDDRHFFRYDLGNAFYIQEKEEHIRHVHHLFVNFGTLRQLCLSARVTLTTLSIT